MSRNDAEDFAQRLYARVPNHYRVYDAERGLPLLALLRVVGAQVANVRQDLDRLWDNFFIETCEDWVVPYIGALVGTNLLQHPVGQSNRLDVWNTVLWRRSKGTPLMLQALAQSTSGWPADLAEFFQSLGWSQDMNHVRLDHPLSPDLRDPFKNSLLGTARDSFAHAADFKPAVALDQSPVQQRCLGVGVAGWGTPGRYQIKNLGVFVRRLQTFPIQGATPAAIAPGGTAPPNPNLFTFNPLFRNVNLFADQNGAPITRAGFAASPWDSFGVESDIAVRQSGVLLATETAPSSLQLAASRTPFSFGVRAPGFSLQAATGMRLLNPRSCQVGATHFLITARWQRGDTFVANLGFLSTMLAASGNPAAFQPGAATSGAGQLVIDVQAGRSGAGWPGPPLPASSGGRFPGAILAIRAAQSGTLHSADGIYVYLPPAFIRPGEDHLFFVADDGSTYSSSTLSTSSLASASQGQVYPARSLTPSTSPASSFIQLNRDTRALVKGTPGALFLTDPSRFAGAGFVAEAALYTGSFTFQSLGAVTTVAQLATKFTRLQIPVATWPAFTYAPSKAAVAGNLPPNGMLSILLRLVPGSPPVQNVIPPAELVVVNRAGEGLLVYLPELSFAPSSPNAPKPFKDTDGSLFFALLVADDGSTYFASSDAVTQQRLIQQSSFTGLQLARSTQGQALPIAGTWPLQQRVPVAINLCRPERTSLLAAGELGIDPELGRFGLPSGDPALATGNFTVDYVEAFSDSIGAVNASDRFIEPGSATRLVSQSGDADSALTGSLTGAPVHTDLADAIAKAKDGDVIEIVDSATYSPAASIPLNVASVRNLTIRAAAGQRPCFTFYKSAGQPLPVAFAVLTPMQLLELNGLLISGGALRTGVRIDQLNMVACTVDPLNSAGPSLISTDPDRNSDSSYVLSRCVTGGLLTGAGVSSLTVADSILDQQVGLITSPPNLGRAIDAARSVQLERVTVLGMIVCDLLNASESLLNDIATVRDQQSGCIRFTRFEKGSVLPRRYRCVPAESCPCPPKVRCVAPLFNSRRYGRPDYAQLAAACPRQILTASEAGAEVGAFAGSQNTIRLCNMRTKLQEFMPVGLSAVIVAET